MLGLGNTPKGVTNMKPFWGTLFAGPKNDSEEHFWIETCGKKNMSFSFAINEGSLIDYASSTRVYVNHGGPPSSNMNMICCGDLCRMFARCFQNLATDTPPLNHQGLGEPSDVILLFVHHGFLLWFGWRDTRPLFWGSIRCRWDL